MGITYLIFLLIPYFEINFYLLLNKNSAKQEILIIKHEKFKKIQKNFQNLSDFTKLSGL